MRNKWKRSSLMKLEKIKLPPLPKKNKKKKYININNKTNNNKESSLISRKSVFSNLSTENIKTDLLLKDPIQKKENPFELKGNKSENLFQNLISDKLEEIKLKEEEKKKELERIEKEKEEEQEIENDIPLYLKYKKFQEKIDLSKKVKLMIPKIDDIEEFEKK